MNLLWSHEARITDDDIIIIIIIITDLYLRWGDRGDESGIGLRRLSVVTFSIVTSSVLTAGAKKEKQRVEE